MKKSKLVAIITGSSRGLGAATAKLLAKKGYHVVINYTKSEASAREVVAACEALGVETLLCRADVSEDKDCRMMVEETVKKWGHIDALVNNAGTTKFCAHRHLDGLNKEDFLYMYGCNVVGPYQMTRAAAPHLKQTGRGAVVNIASLAGVMGLGSSIAYAASKGALITMTLSLARVLGPEIRVNAVCPGFIQGSWLREGMGNETYETMKKNLENSVPLRLTATPEAVAEVVVYFICGAGIVTGETLMLDGGQHLSMAPLGRR